MVNAVTAAVAIVKSLPAVLVFLSCFHEKLRLPMKYISLIILLLECAMGAVALRTVSCIELDPFARMVSSLFSLLIFLAVIRICTKMTISQNIFIVFLIFDITDCIDLLVEMFYSRELPLEQKLALPYLLQFIAVSVFVMYLFYQFIYKYLRPLILETDDVRVWRHIVTVPVSTFFIYRLGISPDYFNQSYTWTPVLRILPLVWTLGTFAIYFFSVYGITVINENTHLEEQVNSMRILTEAHEKQYQSLKKNIETNRRLRHDFRQTLLMIGDYAQKGKCEKILEQTKAYIEELNQESLVALCEHEGLNRILQYYRSRAVEAEIGMEIKAVVPAQLGIDEADLYILTGNLLENALEACGRQKSGERFIKVIMRMASTQVLTMMISNSYEGTVKQKEERFLSSKRSDFGIGLSSVQHIAEKYDGVLRITHEKQIFSVSVLLNCDPDQAEGGLEGKIE